jgi:zinc D-Ala-D-Ala carboxypeptidase
MTPARPRIMLALVAVTVALAVAGTAVPAAAYPFSRILRKGKEGADVRALQVRVAGWFSSARRRRLPLDGHFGGRTKAAVKNFQAHYGLTSDGVAGPATFSVLNSLEDNNKSTAHFNWGEFDQNFNSACGSQANAYAGTFRGGMVARRRAKRNVRRLMWRLEAVRAKGGSNPLGINSGFRSVKYNQCIGGAGYSQHMYGTAADNRMAKISNHRERRLAKHSQLSGIGCYSTLTHNHLDIRLNNLDLQAARFWWWPEKDSKGRDLDESGQPCWGEKARTSAAVTTTSEVLKALEAHVPGAGSRVPSKAEVQAFQDAGEVADLNGDD